MKHSTQRLVEQRKTGLNRKTRRRIILGRSLPDRLMKQRQRLLRIREHLLREIHQLTAEACEETPNYSM
jgi:hypothetical protein